jgi:hypothetical protein
MKCEMWNERVRSNKLIYKFSYEENLDVDAIPQPNCDFPQLLRFQKNNHNEKINDQTKKENEPNKGVDWKVAICVVILAQPRNTKSI